MKFNKSSFPVKATPQEYEKWGKEFFKELREIEKVCKEHVARENSLNKGYVKGRIDTVKEILG